MTTKDLSKMERNLLSHLPGFATSGRLMFIVPVKHILRGISFEGSDFDKKSFYVNMFVLPLCVPTTHLYFNFGSRVRHAGGGDRWNTEMPNLINDLAAALKREALPFLCPIESLNDFVNLAKSYSFTNPHTPQAIAYASARLGDFQNARIDLGQLLQQLDLQIPWQQVIKERAEILIAELRGNPSAAQQRLETWEAETIKNLGLDTFV
jgi:hypothetical protein